MSTKGRSWTRPPPTPGSAAKTGGLISKQSVKVGLQGFSLRMRNPAPQEQDQQGSSVWLSGTTS
jgi:hypothetical protein